LFLRTHTYPQSLSKPTLEMLMRASFSFTFHSLVSMRQSKGFETFSTGRGHSVLSLQNAASSKRGSTSGPLCLPVTLVFFVKPSLSGIIFMMQSFSRHLQMSEWVASRCMRGSDPYTHRRPLAVHWPTATASLHRMPDPLRMHHTGTLCLQRCSESRAG
jgi:hypothetical protein